MEIKNVIYDNKERDRNRKWTWTGGDAMSPALGPIDLIGGF